MTTAKFCEKSFRSTNLDLL